MADILHLRLVTPERLLLDEEVDEVTAPGMVGEFGVFPDHATFLSSLQPGRLSYKQNGHTQSLAVSDGFAEVMDNLMTVLCTEAAYANEIDAAQAQEAVREAEAALSTLSPTDAGFEDAQNTLRLAQVRLDVASNG
ncbi:MAG: F0F1 ATP synthase subunit epsilon [Desulfurellaceae bacterium]|nr:F0F1 ATP synthase subunit epsilon [Desulfurellaceae bacterium]